MKEICSTNNGRCAIYKVDATDNEKALGVAYKLRVTSGLHSCDADEEKPLGVAYKSEVALSFDKEDTEVEEERTFEVSYKCPEEGVNAAMDFYKGFPRCKRGG